MAETPTRRHPWSGGYAQAHQPAAECSRCGQLVSDVQLRLLASSDRKFCVACLRADPAWTEAELRAAWGDR